MKGSHSLLETIFVETHKTISYSQMGIPHYVGYFESPKLCSFIKEKYKIMADPIGSYKPQQNQVKDPPFLLDCFSLAFLFKHAKGEIQFEGPIEEVHELVSTQNKYALFEDLKQKGYFVISANKFGAEFLAYDSDPTKNHAKYLVFYEEEQKKERSNDNLIYLNRLATIAKKEALIGFVKESSEDGSKIVQYRRMQRIQHY